MEERRSGKSSCEVDAREVMSEIDEERERGVNEFNLKPITLGSLQSPIQILYNSF